MKIKAKSVIEAHKPVIHGGLFSKNTSVSGILDFSSNVTPAGTPKQVEITIKRHIDINLNPNFIQSKA